LHQLVAALDWEWLRSEGWTPKTEFPVTSVNVVEIGV
jgi:hypothetical protein